MNIEVVIFAIRKVRLVMKIKSNWMVCVLGEDGGFGNFLSVFDGFHPSAAQIEEYNRVNKCMIISMCRVRVGHRPSVFIGK